MVWHESNQILSPYARPEKTARGFTLRYYGLNLLPLLIVLLPQSLWANEFTEKSFQEKFFQSRNKNVGVDVVAVADPDQVKAGKNFHIRLRVSIPEGWHIYSMKLAGDDASLATVIRFDENIFPAIGDWKESEPRIEMDGVLQKMIRSHSGYAEFSAPLKVPANTSPGVYAIAGTVVYLACDNKICNLPKELLFKTRIQVTAR